MNQEIFAIAQSLVSGDAPEEVLAAYRKALDSHDAPMAVISLDRTICYVNQAACDLAKLRSPDEVVGLAVGEEGFSWNADGASVLEHLEKGERSTFFEVGGKEYACDAYRLYDRLGVEAGVLEVVKPGHMPIQSEGIDELTGISRSTRFYAETRRLLDRHLDVEYALVYWDVIRFKVINDVFSNVTGNMVLRSIAETIRSYVGDDGTYGHFEGGHFVFCIPASLLSTDWLKRHSEVTLISDTAIYTFNSTYGIYEIVDRSRSVEAMCERAAQAQGSLTEASIADGACYAYYSTEMRDRMEEDQELTSQLSYAISENQVKAYFQPIYDLKTGRIASAEALARWEHPERGLVPPGRFIRLFESNGMITGLDKHLWNQVGAFLERRLASGAPVVPVSVNVSRVDFFATTLIEDLDEVVQSHNLPYELLRVEVTESAYADDPTRIHDTVAELRARGFTVLLDDFGSGYSSLNMVKDIPVDILKLDMRFLQDLETSERAKCIVEYIVAMTHKLGFKVVAEGVETQEQADFLRAVDCNLAQGFFYARPQPEASFIDLLDEVNS